MKNTDKTEQNSAVSPADSIKGWIMIILTSIFVLIYVAALFGLIEPPKDFSIISRLEPILFVIIGYYFGRLPAQANESLLKNEINRQIQRADAAQQIKERAQQEREVLEEKIKNAKVILASQKNLSKIEGYGEGAAALGKFENTDRTIDIAIKILDS